MTSNGTKEVLSKVIEYWGFSCPDGGHFYICENIGEQFMGCCTSDPCAKGKGVCPDKDLRAATFDGDSHTDIPSQDCGWKSAADYLYACSYEDSYFLGCCEQNACVSGCPRASLIPMSLSEDFVSRYSLKYPETSSDIPNTTTISIPRPTLTSALVSPKREGSDQNQAKYSMRAEAVAGICVAAVVVVLLLFGAFWRYSHSKGCRRTVSSPQQSSQPTYAPVLHDSSARDTEERPKQAAEVSSIAEIHAERRLPPGRLHALGVTWLLGWAWDIILTVEPTCFIALALVSVHLDEKPLSDFGERVVELTRLSPTIYPILFAAVSSRFYKALARWCLERPNGIGLATLEQIFGSQSFAAAVERVFFVRTQVTIGSGILLLWAMSPLGGQSASRLLAPGNSTTTSNIVVYFSDPGSQFFAFPTWGSFDDKKSIITPLYSSTLMSSQQQKGSPRDLWELPKVPQWSPERQMDEWYDIKDDAFSRGDSHYTSLLGIKIQGLDSSSADQQYDFTVKSSYMDFKCIHAEKLDITPGFTGPFSIEMKAPWGNTLSPEAWARFKSRDDLPPIQLTYTGLGEKPQSSGWSVPFCVMINCTMQTIAVETAIRCGPRPLATSCFARRQRRVKGSHGPNRPPEPILSNPLVLQQVMDYWPWAPGEGNVDEFASPTEIYILGNPHPFTRHPYRAWTEEDLSISPDVFSRYFTTAFNTYWDAALDPYSHTNVSFTSAPAFNIISLEMGQITQPFMNSTSGTRTAVHRVYKANRLWVAILLATTTLLQLLALIGLVLQFFIRGPDVLGFASSLTRDNPYVPLAPGGSSLDGPDRARKLRDLRLQLADVRPESETGYIAVRAVPSVQDEDEQGSKAEWRPLDRKRLYV